MVYWNKTNSCPLFILETKEHVCPQCLGWWLSIRHPNQDLDFNVEVEYIPMNLIYSK